MCVVKKGMTVDDKDDIDNEDDSQVVFDQQDAQHYKEFRALPPAWTRLVSSLVGGAGNFHEKVQTRDNYFKKDNAFPSQYMVFKSYIHLLWLTIIGHKNDDTLSNEYALCKKRIKRKKQYSQLRDQVQAWSKGIQYNINNFCPWALHRNPVALFIICFRSLTQ